MESFLSQYGYAAIFLFAFLEACCVPIPSEVTFGFAGVLAGQGHLNIVAVIVVGTLAELAGSLVSYTIGRVGNAWNKVNHDISLAGYGIVAIAVVAIAAFVFFRLRELRKEEHAEADQEARAHQHQP